MSFDFAVGRIVFGAGRFSDAGALVRDFGARALVVTGRSPDRFERLAPLLEAERIAVHRFVVSEEPTIASVREGVAAARGAGCDLVIGLGGGSALDAAKTVAVLATNHGDALDYLEIIGAGKPLVHRSLPCVAIPTTAGTGSEVTRNAVLGSPEHHVKVSLRSPLMLPRLALVDSELSVTAPPDAVTQLIEAYVSRRANPLSDALCVAGVRHAARASTRWRECSRAGHRRQPRMAPGGSEMPRRSSAFAASARTGSRPPASPTSSNGAGGPTA